MVGGVFSVLASIVSIALGVQQLAPEISHLHPEKMLIGNKCAGGPSKLYDADFRKVALKYGHQDWCLLKAQAIQESGLNPKAKSKVGARGLTQFMPATWKQYQKYTETMASPYDAKAAIDAQGWEMHKLILEWKAPRPKNCREDLALASYNAGIGTVINAQKKAGGVKCLPDGIDKYLPPETQDYVPKIRDIYAKIKS